MRTYNKEIIWQAIDKAERRGYSLLPHVVTNDIEGLVRFKVGNSRVTIDWTQKHWFDGIDNAPKLLNHRTQSPISDILFDTMFAVYLWGSEETYNGMPMLGLKMYLKQVAVKVHDRIIAVRNDQKYVRYIERPPLDYNIEPTELLEVEAIVKKLEDMSYTIPIETHQLTKVSLMGTEPAYVYHMKQMIAAPDINKYLMENI